MTAPSPTVPLLAALEAAWPEGQPGESAPLEVLVAAGYPRKAALYKLCSLADRGLVDYGVSAAYCWRTPMGEQRLAELLAAEASP